MLRPAVSTGEYCSGVSVNTGPAAVASSSQRAHSHGSGLAAPGSSSRTISGLAVAGVPVSPGGVAIQASGPDDRQYR